MPEQIRELIEYPTMYQDTAVAERADELEDIAARQVVTQNVITRTNEGSAHDVANAIKPEIDVITDTKDRIANPYARAAAGVFDGEKVIIGVEDVAQLRAQKAAAQIDLERNAERATTLAIQQTVGRVALKH